MLTPKLFTTLKGYDTRQFTADLTAGLVVGIVALPLAIAFGIASGATPQSGLVTAIVGGFLISALGGSRVQIGGPTGAFVVIVYGVIQQYGMDGLMIATMMAGVILVILGIARLGAAIKFIPYPVTTGFTTGIAIIIFSSQVKDLLGLSMPAVPGDFLAKWTSYAAHLGTVKVETLLVSLFALLILLFWPRLSRRIPSPFAALVVTTVLVRVLHLHVETIGDRFGAIQFAIPPPHLPTVSLPMVRALIAPAFTIALLGGY